jgi:hypothetical protein
MLLTDDPALLQRMSAARSPYTKGAWYDGVKSDPELNNTISEKDEKKHNEMRAKVANRVCKCYFWDKITSNDLCHKHVGKGNPNLKSSIDDRVLDLTSYRNPLPINGAYLVMDFAQVAQYFTLDALTDVTFSKPLGYLRTNTDLHDYIKTVRAYIPV